MQGVWYVLGMKGLHILNHYSKGEYGSIFHFNVAAQRFVSVRLHVFFFLQDLYIIFFKNQGGGGQKQTLFSWLSFLFLNGLHKEHFLENVWIIVSSETPGKNPGCSQNMRILKCPTW